MPKRVVPPLVEGERIVSFDPGMTTGVAIARYLGNKDFDLQLVDQILWVERFQVFKYIEVADRIVCEDFLLYEGKAAAQVNSRFPSSQLIGMIEYCCWKQQKIHKLFYQTASERVNVTVVDAAHKKRLEGKQHAVDAYRHLRLHVLLHRAR